MILNEIFGRKQKNKKSPNKVNPAKLASDYRKVSAMGSNDDHANRLMKDLISAVGEERANALIKQQDSVKKNTRSDVWDSRT